MKWIKSIILFAAAMFFFIGSIGIDVFTHWCAQDGMEVSYFASNEDHCEDHQDEEKESTCCDDDTDGDCCENELQHVQVKLDFFQQLDLSAVILTENSLRIFIDALQLQEEDEYIHHANAPPLLSGREVLLKKQVWVI